MGSTRVQGSGSRDLIEPSWQLCRGQWSLEKD